MFVKAEETSSSCFLVSTRMLLVHKELHRRAQKLRNLKLQPSFRIVELRNRPAARTVATLLNMWVVLPMIHFRNTMANCSKLMFMWARHKATNAEAKDTFRQVSTRFLPPRGEGFGYLLALRPKASVIAWLEAAERLWEIINVLLTGFGFPECYLNENLSTSFFYVKGGTGKGG